MSNTNQKALNIQSVPTNIITGFLGVGKTSAILQLLRHKPANERWAVLVNEFGEIGVDGSLLQGDSSSEQGVYIREVPGGCMCCAAGVPMQIALNQLLIKAKPDRLLIEPTGLGHPKEVLSVLSSTYYREALLLQKTLTLVDARNLTDPRYTRHETFNQQIAIADTIIANKTDLYQADDRERLVSYVKNKAKPNVQILFSQYGDIGLDALEGRVVANVDTNYKHDASHEHSHDHHHSHNKQENTLAADIPMHKCGFIKAKNKGEGYKSIGWRFASQHVFNRQKLYDFFTNLDVERMKAVFNTHEGVYGYNLTSDKLTETSMENCIESRIEIIAKQLSDDLQVELMDCINPP